MLYQNKGRLKFMGKRRFLKIRVPDCIHLAMGVMERWEKTGCSGLWGPVERSREPGSDLGSLPRDSCVCCGTARSPKEQARGHQCCPCSGEVSGGNFPWAEPEQMLELAFCSSQGLENLCSVSSQGCIKTAPKPHRSCIKTAPKPH